MPKLRRLSGDEVIRILTQLGFRLHAQRGSHVKLQRIAVTGERQTLTIPRHLSASLALCSIRSIASVLLHSVGSAALPCCYVNCIMCFEKHPHQCHRQTVAEKIKEYDGNGMKIEHI